jgi:hypothetical protein
VAQNSSTTTLPLRLAQSAVAPKGACSSFRESKGGAGVPFSGCAHSEGVPSKSATRVIRLPRKAMRMCMRSNIRCISSPPNESHNLVASESGIGKLQATYVAFVIESRQVFSTQELFPPIYAASSESFGHVYKPSPFRLRMKARENAIPNSESSPRKRACIVDSGGLGFSLRGAVLHLCKPKAERSCRLSRDLQHLLAFGGLTDRLRSSAANSGIIVIGANTCKRFGPST